MLYRIMVGAMALSMRASALWLMADDLCMAAGAVALGEPADIAKDGVAILLRSMQLMQKSPRNAPWRVARRYRIPRTPPKLDPQNGTPGFGWAMAPNSKDAREQALSNCRDTAGPTRRDASVVGPRGLWCDGSAK
jgi:hypothetical protein